VIHTNHRIRAESVKDAMDICGKTRSMLYAFALLVSGAAFYQFFFAITGLFYRSPKNAPFVKRMHRIGVLITAYKEDRVLLDTAKAALTQYYNKADYEVIVIADSLQEATHEALSELPIRVVRVEFEQSTKSKSLKAAFEQIPEYDAFVVLDADNFMHPTFLQRINDRLNDGQVAIQGQRSHRNTNSAMAILDGMSESVNNHLLCKGQAVVGLSARLAGSGMAFSAPLFKQVMHTIDAIGGFDKALEGKLTALGVHIYYDHQAIIYDEKVSKPEQFAKQRGRWIMAQYAHGAAFWKSGIKGLFKGNIDHFNKMLQMWLPPRLLFPVILLFCALVFRSVADVFWIAFAANIAGFLLGIPGERWRDPQFLRSLFFLPGALFASVKALSWLKAARTKFLHTQHG
jgi:cellulose synthase/poly-beta-1,6-N-acetylglucosamine synthase-like glycosyltransferase